MENTDAMLTKILSLKPNDRFLLIDEIIRSLDQPDMRINSIWLEESAKRLNLHRERKSEGISFEEVFGEAL